MTQERRYGKHSFEPSNEDKVLFPDVGDTKGDLIDYYEAVADFMLPHLKERAVTLRRFPDGVGKDGFFQKAAQDYYPAWIDTVTLTKEGGTITQAVVNSKAALCYLANQAAIEFHVGLATVESPKQPDTLVFDLDPPGDDFTAVRAAALSLRALLTDLGLQTYAKLTGSRGVHVIVPLRDVESFDESREFARQVAEHLAASYPDKLTTEQRKDKRKGRLFLDTLRNAYGQTAVAPYSVRALGNAPVAVPVDWDELEHRSLSPQKYDMKAALRRVNSREDPWKDWRRHARSLEAPRKALDTLRADR